MSSLRFLSLKHDWFRWLVVVGGVFCLVVMRLLSPRALGDVWVALLFLILFTTLDAFFPLALLGQELGFGQLVILGVALLYDPFLASVAGAFGALLGYASRRLFATSPPGHSSFTRAFDHPFEWLDALVSIFQVPVALLLAILVTGWRPETTFTQGLSMNRWQPVVGAMAAFAAFHTILALGVYLTRKLSLSQSLLSDLVMLVVLEFLPLPFLMVALVANPQVGIGSVAALGALSFIMALLMSTAISARVDLEHANLELITLNRISQVLHSSLELDNLLAGLQLQVRQWLSIDNFYIALYDAPIGRIWYPMAVKHGKLVNWPPRQTMERLTDKVILEGQPILMPHHAQLELERIGMPVGEDAPAAWMGVPLISSGNVIGCLGVFSFSPQTVFSTADLTLLSTISGQTSLAIQNTWLSRQVEQSAAQIDLVNQIAGLTTGGSSSDEVLGQICRSAVEVGGGNQCAIFLINPEDGAIRLASSYRLSPAISHYHQVATPTQIARTKCLASSKPEFVGDLDLAGDWMDPDYSQALQNEHILALADFPMITPAGQVGYLSILYTSGRLPDEKQAAFLHILASQAALSVSTIQLHATSDQALAQRLEQLSTLESIGRRLSAATHTQELFEQILDYAMEFTGSPWGRLALVDPESGSLHFKTLRGYPQATMQMIPDQGLCWRAVQLKQPLNVPDVSREDGYIDFTGQQARSHLSIPLIHNEIVLGVLTLESPQTESFSGSHLSFASQLADQAAIALANANLYTSITQGRDRLAAVINSVSEGLLMVDQDGRIILANPFAARLAGCPAEELVGASLPELPQVVMAAFGFTPQEMSAAIELLRSGQVPEQTGQIFRTASNNRILERASSLVWAPNNRLVGWLVLIRDVTEEYQLIQERELLTETLVHDLRSPMGAVLGALDVIGAEQRKEPEIQNDLVKRAVGVGQRGAQRVLNLINSILDIARWESGQMETNLALIKLSDLIEDILAEFLPQAWDYGLALTSDVSQDIPSILADRERIYRVLSNLVDNAVKFTPKGGSIILTASMDSPEKVMVRVSDSGPGIPPAYRQKIFERFRQVPDQQGRRRGSGLGLTFCKLAIQAHGGEIWIEESSQGGSEFVFTLPANQA